MHVGPSQAVSDNGVGLHRRLQASDRVFRAGLGCQYPELESHMGEIMLAVGLLEELESLAEVVEGIRDAVLGPGQNAQIQLRLALSHLATGAHIPLKRLLEVGARGDQFILAHAQAAERQVDICHPHITAEVAIHLVRCEVCPTRVDRRPLARVDVAKEV